MTLTALVEPDALGPRRRRRQHDGGRRDGEVGAVVLADAEDVEPDLVGELDLLDQVAEPLARAGPGGEIAEAREAEFHPITV